MSAKAKTGMRALKLDGLWFHPGGTEGGSMRKILNSESRLSLRERTFRGAKGDFMASK